MNEVVIDHPLPPKLAGSIQVEQSPSPTAGSREGGRWGRIELDPAVAWEICLHPGVCVAGANDVASGHIIELATAKSVHDARGYVQGPQHHGHRRRKILAVSALALE